MIQRLTEIVTGIPTAQRRRPGKPSGTHPDQMPEPPQLTSFDSAEQRLHLELPLDCPQFSLALSRRAEAQTVPGGKSFWECVSKREQTPHQGQRETVGEFLPLSQKSSSVLEL